jgi:hypothetical protein
MKVFACRCAAMPRTDTQTLYNSVMRKDLVVLVSAARLAAHADVARNGNLNNFFFQKSYLLLIMLHIFRVIRIVFNILYSNV